MALPEDLRWVEVDYPHVIGFKESRLTEEAPRCRLKRIELDLPTGRHSGASSLT
jgi:O-methyltransferase involved in polyketide biosynthesis